MKRFTAFLLLFAAVLIAGCHSVPRETWTPTVEKPIRYRNYLTEQGPFVSIPTAVGTIVGIPTMLITAPLCFVMEPENDNGGGLGSDACILFVGPSLFGSIVGSPFLLTRRMLWDYPSSKFRSDPPETPVPEAAEDEHEDIAPENK